MSQVTYNATTARARAAISVAGDLSYNSSTGVISFTNDAGDIESVTAGTGLSGGGSSGAVTINLDMSTLTDMTDAVRVQILNLFCLIMVMIEENLLVK